MKDEEEEEGKENEEEEEWQRPPHGATCSHVMPCWRSSPHLSSRRKDEEKFYLFGMFS
jgi:hypothetical protein